MPSQPLRLALAQAAAIKGDVDANLRKVITTIEDASRSGAQLVVFPELFITGYELAYLEAHADAWLQENDARLEPVRQACIHHQMTAVIGAAHRTRSGDPMIAAAIVSPAGEVALTLKQHLHGSEVDQFRAGQPLPPFGVHGWQVAVGICFDVSRPSHAEAAAQRGTDLYLSSSLYTGSETRRLDVHHAARAMDNRMFVGLANHSGKTGDCLSCGLSGVWDPSGDLVKRVEGDGEALLVVELDPAGLQRFRPA